MKKIVGSWAFIIILGIQELIVGFVMSADPNKLKSSVDFPDPIVVLEQGIVAIGGRLDVGTLYHAYRQGIFPWPQEGLPMLWFCPDERGVLFFDKFHRPKSFERFLKKSQGVYRFTWNQAFEDVIEACRQQKREKQKGTWILPNMKKAYLEFHRAGFAHSVECWRDELLVGGLYGVFVNGVFSGESMFHKEDHVSKLCLNQAIETLSARGLKWMDIQMVTPLLKNFGGEYVKRDQYLKLIQEVRDVKGKSIF